MSIIRNERDVTSHTQATHLLRPHTHTVWKTYTFGSEAAMTTQLAACEPWAGAHAEPALHPRGGSRREPLSSVDGRARAWMGQDSEAVADAPHASSRARRVERRLVGASVGAFGCRNASTACQRDVDGSIQATRIVTEWWRYGLPGQFRPHLSWCRARGHEWAPDRRRAPPPGHPQRESRWLSPFCRVFVV